MPDREKYIEVLSKTVKTVKEFNEDAPIKISLVCIEDILELLKKQETKTGKWIEQEDYNLDTYYDCSVCGESWSTVEGTPWENGMNYCPHCGARMESIICDNRTEGR